MFCNSQGLRKLLEVENKLEPLTPGGEQRKPSHKTTARHITCRTLWTTVVRQFCCTALTSTTRKFVQEKLLDRTKMGGVCFSILFQFPSPPRSHYFFVGCEFLDATNNLLDLVFESDYEPRVLDDTLQQQMWNSKTSISWHPWEKLFTNLAFREIRYHW